MKPQPLGLLSSISRAAKPLSLTATVKRLFDGKALEKAADDYVKGMTQPIRFTKAR
jgi:hypothetical protein